MTSTTSMASAELTVKVVSGASESLALTVEDLAQTTVLALKQLIERQDPVRFPVAAQRLIFQGQILQNDKLLTDYNVASGCAVHLTLTPGVAAAAFASATAARPAYVTPTPVAAPVAAPPSIVAQLRGFLQQMQSFETPAQYTAALQTLQRICGNIVSHPTEERYRKLRVSNAALKSKVFDRTRGTDCVKLLGFQGGVEEVRCDMDRLVWMKCSRTNCMIQGHLVLVPNAERWENLVTGKRVIDEALQSASSQAAPAFGMPAAPASGLGAGFGAGAGAGNWAAQAQAMLQNPAMAQMLANDPRVQQMAQSNPMMAQALQNPGMLAQSLQMMQQNPAMMQQFNQMMSDPNAMARVQQMMAGGGAPGGLGGLGGLGGDLGGFGAPASPFTSSPAAAPANPFAPTASSASPFAAPAPAPAQPPTAPSASSAAATATPASSTQDAASFDEDEIADAIARSLQDQ
jgi:hypothetical protein